MRPDETNTTRQELHGIAMRASARLRRERGRLAFSRELGPSLRLSAIVPVVYLALAVVGRVVGADVPRPAAWALILASLALPVGRLLIRVLGARGSEVDEPDALAHVDRKLELSDRLGAAADFLSADVRTPFMEAAIADAVPHLERARAAEIETADAPWSVGRGSVLAMLAGVACLVAAFLLPAGSSSEPEEEPKAVAEAGGGLKPDPGTDGEDAPVPAATPRETKRTERREGTPSKPADPRERRDRNALLDDAKETEGATGTGNSADASSATGASRSQGTPSQDAPASEKTKKPKKKKKAKPAKKRPREAVDAKKRPGEKSGATAGKGAASGSNKSPAPSEWSSKDQVTSDDEEELETEAEVDDEEDENEARGGVQPSLRDRRPPVNRDLGIGFGNMKNPDANGRGGPSEQKKSRGVATLVLGVPIPDHVKGRPSPGRTKITQERIQPKADEPTAVDAQDRGARQAPAGLLARPDLLPWMRELVKNYYLSVRAQQNPGKETP